MNKRVHLRSLCNFFPKNRRGITLLLENIIFIILNLVFIAILIFFLISKSGSAAVLEEKYAKEIALALDSAKPGMMISINMADAISSAEENLGKNNVNDSIVSFSQNVVTVKLRDRGGYSYSFFNNINLGKPYLDKTNKEYIFFIGE
jgi:hypothetical protein